MPKGISVSLDLSNAALFIEQEDFTIKKIDTQNYSLETKNLNIYRLLRFSCFFSR